MMPIRQGFLAAAIAPLVLATCTTAPDRAATTELPGSEAPRAFAASAVGALPMVTLRAWGAFLVGDATRATRCRLRAGQGPRIVAGQRAALEGRQGARAAVGGAAVMSALPDAAATENEVRRFVAGLVASGQISHNGAGAGVRRVAAVAGVASQRAKAGFPITQRVVSRGGTRVLERQRFACGCRPPCVP